MNPHRQPPDNNAATRSPLVRYLLFTGLVSALALTVPFFHGFVQAEESIAMIVVDADVTGNTPRSVGNVDDCISVSVGERFEVDVTVPAPGVPASRGIAAYQFLFYYDLQIVSVQEVDDKMLLTQAPGSNLVPFSDATPNTTGEYLTVAADFGPQGIEPVGASETGPGVIARLTLQAEHEGQSPLGLRDVQLADDNSTIYAVGDVRSASVSVGSPCPVPSPTASPSPAATSVQTAAPTQAAGVVPSQLQGGVSGGPASGIGALAPAAGWELRLPVSAVLIATGLTGMAAAGSLLRAPAGRSTRVKLQSAETERTVTKRPGNKDC